MLYRRPPLVRAWRAARAPTEGRELGDPASSGLAQCINGRDGLLSPRRSYVRHPRNAEVDTRSWRRGPSTYRTGAPLTYAPCAIFDRRILRPMARSQARGSPPSFRSRSSRYCRVVETDQPRFPFNADRGRARVPISQAVRILPRRGEVAAKLTEGAGSGQVAFRIFPLRAA